jgi:hypothetical protein
MPCTVGHVRTVGGVDFTVGLRLEFRHRLPSGQVRRCDIASMITF